MSRQSAQLGQRNTVAAPRQKVNLRFSRSLTPPPHLHQRSSLFSSRSSFHSRTRPLAVSRWSRPRHARRFIPKRTTPGQISRPGDLRAFTNLCKRNDSNLGWTKTRERFRRIRPFSILANRGTVPSRPRVLVGTFVDYFTIFSSRGVVTSVITQTVC